MAITIELQESGHCSCMENDMAIFLESEASQPQLSTSDTKEFEAFWEIKYDLWHEDCGEM